MSHPFDPVLLYKLITETTDEMINVHAANGTYLYVSPAMLRLTGFRREELIGEEAFNLCHPDDRASAKAGIAEMFRTNVSQRIRYRRLHKDGCYYWMESHIVPIPIKEGESPKFLSVVRDITRNVETEQNLQKQEAQYRNVLNSLPDVVCRLDREGCILYISSSIERETGQIASQLVGQRLATLSRNPEHLKKWMDGIAAVFEKRTVQEFEFTFDTPRGERIYHTRLVPEISEKDVENVLSIAQDVTDSRIAISQKLMLERRLQEGQRMESLGVLAGGIAHDFNNLLMSVMGYSELALNALPEIHPAREHLEQVGLAARRAADLTKQMLAFAGKRKYAPKAVNLNSMVKEISKLLKISIARNSILDIELAEDLPMLEGEATQLRQIIMNLVINASEALNGEPGTISIRTGTQSLTERDLQTMRVGSNIESGEYLMLSVKDTGTGMTEETLARIFEPFYTTKFTGRGLGLAAAVGIIEGHQGAMQVVSQLEKGTEFLLFLPISKEEEEEVFLPEPPTEATGGRILIVDDEEPVRNVAAQMLEAGDYSTMAASGVEEAIGILEREGTQFDALLLDFLMPDGGGTRVAERAREVAPDLPILLMSGYNGNEVLPETETWRDVVFLQKPFTLKSLFNALLEAQEKKSAIKQEASCESSEHVSSSHTPLTTH